MASAAGTFRVTRITGDDKNRAVKRALESGTGKVRITPGQGRAIVRRKRATSA